VDTLSLVGLSIGLGLFGFIEPCTVGSHLLFVKYLENKSTAEQLAQTLSFTVTRALFIGVLGALAALVGSAFLNLQQGFWILLGVVYVLLGLVYLLGRQGALMRTLGPNLGSVRKTQGAAALGLVFGLNIPACAAPLLAAVLGANLGAATVGQGFLTMALFGVALSLPLVAVVVWKRARGWLHWLASLSQKLPLWTGVLFILLGVWSIFLAL
jgi:cytochrome c-type biogenesis protein